MNITISKFSDSVYSNRMSWNIVLSLIYKDYVRFHFVSSGILCKSLCAKERIYPNSTHLMIQPYIFRN